MKVTKQELAQLIKEELDALSREESVVPGLHYLETSPLNPESWEAIDDAARMKERGERGQLQVDAPPIDLSRPMPTQVNLPSQELKSEDIGIWESLPDWAKVAIMVGGAGALQYGMSKIPSRKLRWEEQPEMPHIRHGKSPYQVGQLEGDDLKRHLLQQYLSQVPDWYRGSKGGPGSFKHSTRVGADLWQDFMDKYTAAGFKE